MLSGAREKQPLERSPSQTNTGLHQGFPQTSTHFSVLAMGFFFFLPQTHINTHTYIQKQKENVRTTKYSEEETVFTILSNFRRVSDELLSLQLLPDRSLPACLPDCLPALVSQSEWAVLVEDRQDRAWRLVEVCRETEAIRQAAAEFPWVHSPDLLLPVLLRRRGCCYACERGPFIC